MYIFLINTDYWEDNTIVTNSPPTVLSGIIFIRYVKKYLRAVMYICVRAIYCTSASTILRLDYGTNENVLFFVFFISYVFCFFCLFFVINHGIFVVVANMTIYFVVIIIMFI
jgi:hypothetical protein